MAIGFITDGNEFQVNTYTTAAQTDSDVAALEDGGFIVVWDSNGQDIIGDYGVFAQRYDVDGNAVFLEFQVNTFEDSTQRDPKVTSLKDGGYIVSWESLGPDGSNYGIFAQRYTAAGTLFGTEFQVNSFTTSTQYQTDITGLESGGFVITWSSYQQDGDSYGIYAQIYDETSAKIGGEFQVSTFSASAQYRSSVSALSDGGFVVTWESYNQDAGVSDYGIYGQKYSQFGAKIGGEFLVNTNTADSQRNSNVQGLDGGGFVVVWESYGQDGDSTGIYMQVFDNNGNDVGSEMRVNTTTASVQSNPDVAALSDGGFVVVWQDGTGMDGDGYGIYGQRYDADGVVVGGEVQINTYTTSQQQYAAVAALKDGGFVVTWSSDGQDGNSGGIFSQKFAPQLFGTSGKDTMTDNVGADWMNGQGGNDTLKGLEGRDLIYGGGGKDTLIGGADNDKLYGQGGSDTLSGGSGNDKLFGNKGNDTLKGGNGNDKLVGGKGKDVLTGGNGADIFQFNKTSESATNSAADIITDFELGVDRIDLASIANLSFIGGTGFSGAAEVRVTTSGGDSLVKIDKNGDGSMDSKIVVEGVTGLTESDFIL